MHTEYYQLRRRFILAAIRGQRAQRAYFWIKINQQCLADLRKRRRAPSKGDPS